MRVLCRSAPNDRQGFYLFRRNQTDLEKPMESNLSIYIHIPFCRSRCSYCDFVTSAGKLAAIPEYLDTLRAEIGAVASRSRIAQPVHSVYFGGGTPSLLTPVQLRTVLEFVRGHFQLTSDVEITLEANPGDCSQIMLPELLKRVSIGSALECNLRAESNCSGWLAAIHFKIPLQGWRLCVTLELITSAWI